MLTVLLFVSTLLQGTAFAASASSQSMSSSGMQDGPVTAGGCRGIVADYARKHGYVTEERNTQDGFIVYFYLPRSGPTEPDNAKAEGKWVRVNQTRGHCGISSYLQ